MKRLILLVLVALVTILLFVLSGCGTNTSTDTQNSGKKQQISLATGSIGGTYYPLGGAIAQIINEEVPSVQITAEATGASVENVKLMENGDAAFAILQSGIAYNGYKGSEMFSQPVEKLRGVASLWPNTFHIVTLSNSGINSINDLVGKRVAVGGPGSVTVFTAELLFKAAGIDKSKVDVRMIAFAEGSTGLKDGTIDAAFIDAGIPNSSVMDIASTNDVKIIPIPTDVLDNLIKEHPEYSRSDIPAGTYKGQNEVINSFAVQNQLYTVSDLSEDLVYDITKAMFENLDQLYNTHNSAKVITLEAAPVGFPVPMHPGAEKYYREKGVLK